MITLASSPVTIQTSEQSVPRVPGWFGEVAVVAHSLQHVGVLATVEEHVRFARRRFGHYDLVDFVVVLLGYAISGERTLEAFYENVQPFATPFMALFGREHLPHRSTLSRFLAALTQATVETLRAVFLEDLVARPLEKEGKTGGLWDRQGTQWLVFDVDGTRQAACQRACHRPLICQPPSVDWMRCALQATSGASGERRLEPGRPCSRPTRTSGLARFRGHQAQAMVSIGASYDKRKARSARIHRRNPFH